MSLKLLSLNLGFAGEVGGDERVSVEAEETHAICTVLAPGHPITGRTHVDPHAWEFSEALSEEEGSEPHV